MSNMIERVARAIADEGAYILPGESHQDVDRRVARAAVQALREPTDEMVKAGAHGSGEDSETTALGAWQAMIDSILSTQPQEQER